MASYIKGADHRDLKPRMNKIEGQIRGISKMIDDRKYCVDILTQLKAARSALKSVELSVLENHSHKCIKQAVDSGSPDVSEEKIKELMSLLKKMI